ncbi:sigma-70 family RNA polymerase sigma factor [Actinomycetes bacterium KLBMP 9797]
MTESQVETGARDPAALVTAAQAGDAAALAELVSAHLPFVYGVIGRMLGAHPDVDDLVQETMVRVMRGLPDLREPDRFRSWVGTIAQRQVLLHLRSRKDDLLSRRELGAELPDPRGDFVDRTVTELLFAQQRQELLEAARWLDHDDQRLLALWSREAAGELSRAELAAALSISEKHASVRLRRMKVRLDAARAISRALHGSPRCAELATLIRPWNGTADGLWRKRLSRHVRGCRRCGQRQIPLLPPEKLLGLAAVPMATGLATTAPATASGWSSLWAGIQSLLANKMVAGAAAATIATGGMAYAVFETTDTGGAPTVISPTAASRPTPPVTSVAPSSTGSPPARATPTVRAGAGTGVTTADIYVAPDGSDAGTGGAARPYATLAKAIAVVRPGQTIALRGGTYRPTAPVEITTSGTARRRITISNYRDERPVIDAGRVPPGSWAISQRASYWTVQGLELMNAPGHAYVCVSCRDNVFARLSIHDNADIGLLLRGAGTAGNQVLDSDFFANHDTRDAGGTADGLAFKYGSGAGNLVRGCRMYHNSADGLDLSDFTDPVTVERSWSYGNGVDRWNIPGFSAGGGSGFKLGGGDPAPAVGHVVTHSAAWDNAGYGFTEAGNRGRLSVSNSTAYRNGKAGFAFVHSAAVLRRDLSLANQTEAWLGDQVDDAENSWREAGWTPSVLRSGDPLSAQGPRQADGSLPATTFLLNRRDPAMGAAMAS